MHEFLTGHSPFLTSANEVITEEAHKKRILDHEPSFNEVHEYPESDLIKDFLSQLLNKDAENRLGKCMAESNGSNGIQ